MADRLTLSINETALLLGISRNLTYELVKQNRLPALRLGRRLVIPKVALEKLLAGEWPKAEAGQKKKGEG